MERHLIHRAIVHGQATQFMLRIADASHAIVNVILRSLSFTSTVRPAFDNLTNYSCATVVVREAGPFQNRGFPTGL